MGDPLAPLVAALGVVALVPALVLLRDGRWSAPRTVALAAGIVAALLALVGPLADAGHHDFRAHMAGHLLLGMLAPLLLVLADPVTLALRALPVRPARRLVRVLRARPIRLLTHPATATVLNVGGLWVLYRTGLYAAAMMSPTLHVLVMAHVVAAGWLFTHAVVGRDPTGGASFPVRATFLVGGLAAHAVLAKSLYAAAPAGVDAAAARSGALLMYYGGDAVDVVLMIVLCARWYAATAPGRAPVRVPARRPRPASAR